MTTLSLIGKGIYSIPEVGKIVHAHPNSIRRWVKGYAPSNGRRFSPRILPSEIVRIEGEDILTFQQLIEVLFINLFRHYNISMPVIRAAARQASIDFGTQHPFAIKNLKTDGKRIFSLTAEDVKHLSPEDAQDFSNNQIVKDLAMGQYVIGQYAELYFKKIDYEKFEEKFEAVRYWPLGSDKKIVIDPQRSFGQPIDVKTGVPTKVVYAMYQAGERTDVIGKWYDMDEQAVKEAIDFERSLTYQFPKAA